MDTDKKKITDKKTIIGITVIVFVLIGGLITFLLLNHKTNEEPVYTLKFGNETLGNEMQYVTLTDYDVLVEDNSMEIVLMVNDEVPKETVSHTIDIKKPTVPKTIELSKELSNKVINNELTLEQAVNEINQDLDDSINTVIYEAILEDTNEINPLSELSVEIKYIVVEIVEDVNLDEITDITLNVGDEIPKFEIVLPNDKYAIEYLGLDKVNTENAGTYNVDIIVKYGDKEISNKTIVITIEENDSDDSGEDTKSDPTQSNDGSNNANSKPNSNSSSNNNNNSKPNSNTTGNNSNNSSKPNSNASSNNSSKPNSNASSNNSKPSNNESNKPKEEAKVPGKLIDGSAMLSLVNEARSNAGSDSLKWSNTLADYAKVRAKELCTLFSHNRPDGSSWSTVGSEVFGENISAGYSNYTAAFNAWMKSKGHKENIETPYFTSIGIAGYQCGSGEDKAGYGSYWVQLFGID